MHFWINKSNQQGWRQGPACRRPPPLAVAAYYKRHNTRGYYPKPMVTPVRRFQSIENFPNSNGPRRAPYFHNNYHANRHQAPSHGAQYNHTRNHHIERDQESLQVNPRGSSLALEHIPTKYKCGFISLFLLLVLIVIATNYYLSGNPFALGIEALLVICILALILLIGGGWLFIFDEAIPNRGRPAPPSIRAQRSNSNSVSQHEQTQTNPEEILVPTHDAPPLVTPHHHQEDPPPYDLAILMSPQSDLDAIEVIRGDQSPPPSYEKAVT